MQSYGSFYLVLVFNFILQFTRIKFDKITDNPDVNKTLYYAAKQALIHRSGTRYEDMFWGDKTTGKVVGKILDSTIEENCIQ